MPRRRAARDLVVYDAIRVAEPRLSERRVETVVTFEPRTGRPFRLPLRFVYDRPVVGEGPLAENWARVLCAVPPLNYALFARRLVLEYAIEREDKAWLEESLAVTAREQVLNRIVSDNPLILPEYRIPEAEFEPAMVERVAAIEARVRAEPRGEWPTDPDHHVVLSSGGKESLTSYGILRELGKQVAPLFANESGRHWHTALTSYRHFEKTEPRTRRVWLDVDRFYVGVNRRLPLVHPRFQVLRADTYPVQLFTFHVYQLASLPVCWAEGAGRLWMGNEYDEGPWPEVKGVRHWNAIYDQSQEFDLRASAYYRAKRWGVVQASLVRALSGPKIQEILARRYPDLFRTQTSCHATTIRNGAVRPCGVCSKCVGVLLFLGAAGADATRIRYAKAHLARLPDAVATTSLKLEPSEAEHCLARLVARGFPFTGSANGFVPRPRPEVEALRFDDEMSRRENLPKRLAAEVYPLLLRDAKGAIAKEGGAWRALPDRFWS